MKSLRQRKLIEILGKTEIMSRNELAKTLGVAQVTIRRDLEELENEGLVTRVHGGARIAHTRRTDSSFDARTRENAEVKRRIGEAAALQIEEGDVAMFDGGTTTLAAIVAVSHERHFTAVTNAMQAGVALCQKPRSEIVVIGGHVHHPSQSAADQDAVEQIRRLRADTVFLSTRGLTVRGGTFEPTLSLVRVKQAMADSSRRVIVLADHTKFGVESLQLTIPTERIDLLITDTETATDYIDDFRKTGMEIQVV